MNGLLTEGSNSRGLSDAEGTKGGHADVAAAELRDELHSPHLAASSASRTALLLNAVSSTGQAQRTPLLMDTQQQQNQQTDQGGGGQNARH